MTRSVPIDLRQFWPLPSKPRPIVVIGAGAIVHDAHLPSYAAAGLPVAGIYDPDAERARSTADHFGVKSVFTSLTDALATDDAVFDIAVPPDREHEIVDALPHGAVALLQKPLGIDFNDAARIVDSCRHRRIVAAVNFQLRFSPMMLALQDVIDRGELGDILDLDIHLACRTPWENWPFMAGLSHVEVPMHSIHYLDWIRSVLGEPEGVYSRSLRHPDHPELNDARTSTILDFGDRTRCSLSLNHTYRFGPRHQSATIAVEGSRGAARVTLGLLLNYPHGEPETLEVADSEGWWDVPLRGRWFPQAFAGVMSNLQRFAAGEDAVLHTHVEDALKTMSLVAACSRSSDRGGAPISQLTRLHQ